MKSATGALTQFHGTVARPEAGAGPLESLTAERELPVF